MKKKPVRKADQGEVELIDDARSGMGLDTLWRDYVDNLICVQGRGIPEAATV